MFPPLRPSVGMVGHTCCQCPHISPEHTQRGRVSLDNATRILRAMKPTITHPDAARVRDLGDLVHALRDETACELVANEIERRQGGQR